MTFPMRVACWSLAPAVTLSVASTWWALDTAAYLIRCYRSSRA